MDEIQKTEDLFKEIKKKEKFELYSALDLIYRCGLEQKEVCNIEIGDLEEKENSYVIDTHAKKKERFVTIDGKAYNSLKKYLEDATQSLNTNNDSPLFPKYQGESGTKKMRRHCEKYPNGILPKEICFVGIKAYDKKLSVIQTDKNKRIEIVAEKFRSSSRAVKDILNGKKKKAGPKPLSDKQTRDLEMIRLFDALGSSHDFSEIKFFCIDFYYGIEKYDFSEEHKNNLIKMWENKVSQQTSSKLISDQSKKNTGLLDIVEIMEMIHKPYLLNEFDKELIEEEYKKMYDYFFPNNKVLTSRRKKTKTSRKRIRTSRKKRIRISRRRKIITSRREMRLLTYSNQ